MTNKKGRHVPAGMYGDRTKKAVFHFVSVDLDAKDLEALEKAEFDWERFQDNVARWLEQGYKVSFSHQKRGNTWCCSLIGGEDAAIANDRGGCISAFGNSLGQACLCMVYKWEIYCQGGFPSEGPSVNRPDFA